MKFKYETAIATFIQFILVSLFVLVTQLGSNVVGCFKNSNDCISNIIVSLIFFILTSVAFGFIWLIGFTAQERRGRRMAQFLICIEAGILLLALFSLKLNLSTGNIFGLIGSIGMTVMSSWIILLSWRLMKAEGGRVVVKSRRRR